MSFFEKIKSWFSRAPHVPEPELKEESAVAQARNRLAIQDHLKKIEQWEKEEDDPSFFQVKGLEERIRDKTIVFQDKTNTYFH